MKRNTILALIAICLAAALMFAGCGSADPESEDGAASVNDEEIIESVMDNFNLLAEVPRPSHHEKKISNFLMKWAKEQGFEVAQDGLYNLKIEVPATEGFEKRPLCILQGHMDMVVAVEDGKDFNKKKDTVTVVYDEEANTLTADGTSLGADDGAGLAIMMAIAQGKMEHGPLRLLITVCEEDGMGGAFGMDPSWFDDAKYLINIDNEASNEVLVSTAAGTAVYASGELSYHKSSGDCALNIVLKGLKGGHSGLEIDKGRLNGLIGLAGFLKTLRDNGIPFGLASFKGGTAGNAIPPKASCTIVIFSKDLDKVRELGDAYYEKKKKEYAEIEDGMTFTIEEADTVPKVVSARKARSAVHFLTSIVDGVNSWSKDMDGLVESSSNLGIFTLDKEGVSATVNIRSSSGAKQTKLEDRLRDLAKRCGYRTNVVKIADPWPYDPNSPLLALTEKIYKEQNGEEIDVVAAHAGHECGTFKKERPKLDMISVGPDISGAHTTEETLNLDSVPKVWNLLEELLKHLK